MNEEQLCQFMVNTQIKKRGIHQPRILEAFLHTPRHEFVPPAYKDLAYHDRPLPIGNGQTISQPYIVALMTQMIAPHPDHIVLEIGTGSGYQAAILSFLVARVYSIERHETLFNQAQLVLKQLDYKNIHLYHGDGSQGLPDEAPFDSILITAAAPQIPPVLFQQIRTGGKIVAPVGSPDNQILVRWTKTDQETFIKEEITPVAFVPLRGKYGWINSDWPETD